MIEFQRRAFNEWNAMVDGYLVARVRQLTSGQFRVEDVGRKEIGFTYSQIAAFDLVKQEYPFA